MNRAQRNIWLQDNPIGAPDRGAPYGERLDPAAMSSGGGWMSLAGTAMSVIGNMQAGDRAVSTGQAKGNALDYEAAQLDQNANAAIAASQRDAIAERLKTTLTLSRGIAVAAASGGGASDPTVVNILSQIAGNGEYRSASAIYAGEDKARALRAQATGRRFEAGVARQGGEDLGDAYTIKAIGSGLAGGASLFAKYGNGGPSKTTDINLSSGGMGIED